MTKQFFYTFSIMDVSRKRMMREEEQILIFFKTVGKIRKYDKKMYVVE